MPSPAPGTIADLLLRAADVVERGGRVYAAILTHARGSTPQSAGAVMFIDDAANTFGTIGGGCVEAEVRREVVAMIGSDGSGILTYKLDHDYGWDDGLICGGTITLAAGPLDYTAHELREAAALVERRAGATLSITVTTDDGPARYTLDLPPKPRLYIAGAGHVGAVLARYARDLDFDVTVFDDRPDLLDRLDTTTVVGDIRQQLQAAAIDDATYCVIVTRGHRHDEEALEAVIERGARYIGMIGSRRKVKLIFDDLRERGISDAALADVHAPIGIDINSITVPEIAMSIAAELVQVRRADDQPVVRGPESVAATVDV